MTCVQRQIPLEMYAHRQCGYDDELGNRYADAGKKNDKSDEVTTTVNQQQYG